MCKGSSSTTPPTCTASTATLCGPMLIESGSTSGRSPQPDSDDRFSGLDPGPQERGETCPVRDRVTERQLVELRALQEEVQVMLPGEADATMDLQRRCHHPL